MDFDDLAPVPPRPTNWDELFAITGGLTGIPIEDIQVGRPDHPYHFHSGDLRKCGRLGCERRHCNGLLVAISGRRFVHIGRCCASRYVTNTERWSAALRNMRLRAKNDAQNEAMAIARSEAQKTLHWLDNDPAIEFAARSLESFLQQAKGPIRAELEKRAEKRQVQVQVQRRLSKEERDSKRVMLAGNQPDAKPIWVDAFEPIVIGELSGLDCIRAGHAPRELKRRLEGLIWALLKWTPEASGMMGLDQVHRSTRDLIPFTNDLKESIRNVEKFLRPANLDLLCKLEVSRSQGVRSIQRHAGELKIIRAPHWNKAA